MCWASTETNNCHAEDSFQHHSGWLRFHCILKQVINGASLVAQTANNLPAVQETRVQSLGEEYPLEKGMATTPVFLPGKIPWTKEPGGLQSMEVQRVGHD